RFSTPSDDLAQRSSSDVITISLLDLCLMLVPRCPTVRHGGMVDWVRAQARTEHTKPTQLIRRWIEEHRSTGQTSLEERVRRLEDLVRRGARSDS
ncbi:MAG: hypothetical protein ACRDTC_11010, partial [Pseudonocardiaceae bacterium]